MGIEPRSLSLQLGVLTSLLEGISTNNQHFFYITLSQPANILE